MKKILIDDCLKKKKGCQKAYLALVGFPIKNLCLEEADIISISEYHRMNSEQKDDLWRFLHAIYLHAKSTRYTYLLTKACDEGVPVIMVRGKKTDAESLEVWSGAFQEAGWKVNPDELCSSGKLFYQEDESFEIQGATRWITDYYHNLKDIAVEHARHDAIYNRRKFEQVSQKVLFESLEN